MARKGNQQRNGVDRHTSNHKRKVSDSRRAPDMKRKGETSEVNALHGEEIPNGNQPTGLHKTYHAGDENKINENSGTVPREKKPSIDEVRNLEESVLFGSNSQDPSGEPPGVREENGTPISGSDRSGLGHLFNTSNIKSMMENVVLSGDVLRNLRASALSILQVVGEWMERHEPVFGTLKGKIYSGRDFVMSKIEKAYPIALKWLTQFGNIVLLLLMVWLDCTLRGVDSFLRLGTTSFLTILWCTILSVIAMVGMPTFLIVLAIAAFVGVFIGLILGLLAMAIAGFIFLWSYGSFWTTLSLIVIGGLAFILSHERLALFITTVYSMYSVWSYLGLTGLLLALNLSFVTSDILIYFLKNNINQQRRSNRHADQSAGMEGRPGFFSGQSFHPSSPEAGTGASAERSSGAPSTSGVDAEITSEDEVTRLLNCTDHYSVLGLSRFENVDISLLKKEYRKKAMLVHPDKNMGNEKAAEAFKKLQNAYEVLIDSAKQKAYDDELRSEELLNYFRRFQSTSQKV